MFGCLAGLEGSVSMAVFFCLTGYRSRRGLRNSAFGTKLTLMPSLETPFTPRGKAEADPEDPVGFWGCISGHITLCWWVTLLLRVTQEPG